MNPLTAHRRRARGFAMLEALVAVLLLSLSALAYAALQLRGLSANSSALWRSKAVPLTQEMADRMRANQAGVAAGSYTGLLAPAAAPGCGTATACTPAQAATLDYALWSAELATALPGGTGVVCLDGTPDDGAAGAPACDGQAGTYAIKVFWSERGVSSRLSMELRP